jgi:hypothetical protein
VTPENQGSNATGFRQFAGRIGSIKKQGICIDLLEKRRNTTGK